MSRQKITLGSDGVVRQRMRPAFVPGGAKHTPAVRLSRLHQLLRSQHPHICVVRGEGLGDVIMTTPTIRSLKAMFDKVDITYATNTKYLDGALVKVLKYNPDISYIIERELMDDYAFDLVVNLHCPAVNFEKRGMLPPNRIDLFANHAGVKLSDPVPKFYIQKEEVDSGEVILQSTNKTEKLMLVQPFSSSKARSGMHSKIKNSIIKLYQQHGIRSIIITHSSDSFTDVLWDNVPGSIYLRDLDVRAIAGVMVHCDLVLCPDSSILHLAGCLDIPTVSLFGPTPPQCRINYYKNAVALCEAKFGPCHCWYESCPIGNACWEYLTEEMIVTKCAEHLNNTQRVDINMLLERTKPIEIETEVI